MSDDRTPGIHTDAPPPEPSESEALATELRSAYNQFTTADADTNEARFALGHALSKARAMFPSGHVGDRAWGQWKQRHAPTHFSRTWESELVYGAEHEEEVRAVLSTQVDTLGHTNFKKAVEEVRHPEEDDDTPVTPPNPDDPRTEAYNLGLGGRPMTARLLHLALADESIKAAHHDGLVDRRPPLGEQLVTLRRSLKDVDPLTLTDDLVTTIRSLRAELSRLDPQADVIRADQINRVAEYREQLKEERVLRETLVAKQAATEQERDELSAQLEAARQEVAEFAQEIRSYDKREGK